MCSSALRERHSPAASIRSTGSPSQAPRPAHCRCRAALHSPATAKPCSHSRQRLSASTERMPAPSQQPAPTLTHRPHPAATRRSPLRSAKNPQRSVEAAGRRTPTRIALRSRFAVSLQHAIALARSRSRRREALRRPRSTAEVASSARSRAQISRRLVRRARRQTGVGRERPPSLPSRPGSAGGSRRNAGCPHAWPERRPFWGRPRGRAT